MERSGPRLLDYVKGKIYSGIKTGLNKAFVLDSSTRDSLLAKDKKNNEVLMPLLRGEDMRRYEALYHETSLIVTKIGTEMEKYPTILEHLRQYKKQAEQRSDQGNFWWELRACAYYTEFSTPKIIYGEIAPQARFSMDFNGYYLLNTSYFIPVDDWYLLAVLNSYPIDWYFRKIGAMIQQGYLRFIRQYVGTLPIPDAPEKERKIIGQLAQKTQNLHSQRRAKVENFLRAIGTSPAKSNSRNPLEKPWLLNESDFTRRAKKFGTPDVQIYKSARDETADLTGKIETIEAEIDARVKALYGV